MAVISIHEAHLKRWAALKSERSSWVSHWTEISDYLLPRSGRFVSTDRNRGEKRHNNIYDSTATRALRTLAAGMMSGMTSPARPWFRLAIPDDDLMEYTPVKMWLDDVSKRMRRVFSQANTYRALHQIYQELGAFGTAACVVADDFDNVLHHYSLTCGQYAIATDGRNRVTTLYREFDMTVGQMVAEFGKDKCSITVQNMFDRGTLDAWVTVMHAIEPRTDREVGKSGPLNMPFKSCYFEPARQNHSTVLRESGFERFPALCPRWDVTGEDIYGNGPGMEALGDIKQLQQEQLRKSQAIDFQTKPPVQVPTALKGQGLDMLPGGVSFYDGAGGANKISSLFDVRLDLSHLLMDIQDVRQRINATFYADLFLMLSNLDKTQMTATEVAERHEEKLLMLGPTLERLNNEMLDPLIDMTFDRMMAVGIVPEPPPELQGQDLNIEYVSVLAQAQRAVGTNSVNRLLGTLGSIAAVKPEVLDKIDADQVVDVYADLLGVDPSLIVSDDDVAEIRAQRAKAQQAAQMAQMVPAMADTAKTLSETDTSKESGLSNMMQQFSGYGA